MTGIIPKKGNQVMSNSLKNMWVMRKEHYGQIIKVIGAHTVLIEYAKPETAVGPPMRELVTIAELVEERANFFHCECEMEDWMNAIDEFAEADQAAKAAEATAANSSVN
jgi:hypothetical protein